VLLQRPAYAAWWTNKLCDFNGCNPNQQAELTDILKVLDVPEKEANPPKATVRRKTDRNSVEMEIGPADMLILKGSQENVVAAEHMLKQISSQQLLDRSKSLQDKAIARAERYLKDGATKKDLADLKQTVQEDLDVRQRLQLAEIEFLKARLANFERRIRQKEPLKDRIIERRIESLLIKPANEEKNPPLTRLKTLPRKWTWISTNHVIGRTVIRGMQFLQVGPAGVSGTENVYGMDCNSFDYSLELVPCAHMLAPAAYSSDKHCLAPEPLPVFLHHSVSLTIRRESWIVISQPQWAEQICRYSFAVTPQTSVERGRKGFGRSWAN
jgi:hypothetical protein